MEPFPVSQGKRQNPSWIGHLSIAGPITHTHTHSEWDNLDTPFHLTCTSLGCGRKLEYLEKTQADMGENIEHRDSCPSWECIFFFFFTIINIIMKQCYSRTCHIYLYRFVPPKKLHCFLTAAFTLTF